MIRVLVVDDSAVVRKILTEELSRYDDIEVVGSAVDPYVAREKIATLSPDVLTLDIEMPRMDGLSFLGHLMKHHPLPVVVVSSVAPHSSRAAVQALSLGAVDVIAKPSGPYSVPDVGRELARAIRVAARVDLRHGNGSSEPESVSPSAPVQRAPGAPCAARPVRAVHAAESGRAERAERVIAIGASTGGTKAIEAVLTRLPAESPGTVVVQHMPAGFTASFAARLDERCAMRVSEAVDNDDLVPGQVLIAPGGHHLVVQRSGTAYKVRVKDGPLVHHQRPAVDVLFHSVARQVGRNAVGVLLTGMGSDGASGLLAMRQSGAHTIAEAESSCVVFGMPREAIEAGAAVEVAPLTAISGRIVAALR